MKTLVLIGLSSVSLYGQWITGFYASGGGQAGETPSAIPWSKYTHIIQQQVWPNSDGTLYTGQVAGYAAALIAARPSGKKVLIQMSDEGGFMFSVTSPGSIA